MSKRTEVIGCLLSVIVVGACAPHQPAMADESQSGVARSAVTTSDAAAPRGDGDEASFPLSVWRGIEFPDRNNLSGALLPTAQGTIQIKKLQWGVDRDGFLIVCSLTGYTQDGTPTSFVGSDADVCTSAASKRDVERATVAVDGGGELLSFGFGANREGFLMFTDIVYLPGIPVGLQNSCGFVETVVCRSEQCSGACGTPVIPTIAGNVMTLSIGGGSGGVGHTINCSCTGQTGSCVAEARRTCLGECNPDESCVMDLGPAGLRCICE